MIYDFSVYFKDECIADVHIDTEKNETSIKRYILGPKQPFMCERQDIHYIYGFLESRCFDNGWPDTPPILKANETNPYEWCRKTHGIMYNDFWWIRFPDENITWNDVKVR